MNILGIDVGGSGIKGAIVNTEKGVLLTERIRVKTPQPALPDNVGKTIRTIVKNLQWDGPIGVGFPAAIQNGIVKTATNIDSSWVGANADKIFLEKTKNSTITLNDADAAGLAEMKFGAGQNNNGVVILITVGTGIGTVIFSHGELLPNTELGHIYLENGLIAENYASDAVRKNEALKWKKWGQRFNTYLQTLEDLFWPNLFILGGGASKKFDKFSEVLSNRTKIVPAQLLNNAGIIGAAIAARRIV